MDHTNSSNTIENLSTTVPTGPNELGYTPSSRVSVVQTY